MPEKFSLARKRLSPCTREYLIRAQRVPRIVGKRSETSNAISDFGPTILFWQNEAKLNNFFKRACPARRAHSRMSPANGSPRTGQSVCHIAETANPSARPLPRRRSRGDVGTSMEISARHRMCLAIGFDPKKASLRYEASPVVCQ
jgi:hypothetical protein